MGKSVRSLLVVLLLFLTINYGQNPRLTLEVSPGISQLNLASLIVNENLDGVPRIFRVDIQPVGVKVILRGSIHWTPVNNGGEKLVYWFITKPFDSHSFTNRDLDRGQIKIQRDEEGSDDVIEELRRLGTLTGKIRIELSLLDPTNQSNLYDSKSRTLHFDNPVQTLKVLSPNPGSVEDVGSVIARWDRIPGAKSYRITLIQKRSKDQSDEDALTSGKPLIENKDVGDRNQVNLRTLLDRQWVPGMELVFQVKAVTDAAGGELELKSMPTSFFLEDPNDETKDIVDPMDLFDLLEQGNLRFDQLKRVTVDGRRLNPQELMMLIRKFKNNPEIIVNKRFLGKSGR